MKKCLLFLLMAVLTRSAVFGQKTGSNGLSEKKAARGINFISEDWNLALENAAAQNKFIFVDAYASWCLPCKILKVTTFRNKKAGDFFNEKFVSLSIDMEKKYGPALAKKWGIQAYPTLIILTPRGEPVIGTVGSVSAEELINFGKEGLKKAALISYRDSIK